MVRKRTKIEKLSDKMSEREASGSLSRHLGTLLPSWFSLAYLGINVQRASHSQRTITPWIKHRPK